MKNKKFFLIHLIYLLLTIDGYSSENLPLFLKVEGDVSVELNGKRIPAKNGQYIPWGSTIFTGEAGNGEIQSPDGSTIKLFPSSVLTIDESLIENRSRLMLSLGVMWSRVAKFFSEMVSFRAYSPSAVCGVRGTSFFMETGFDGSSLIYVEEGSVIVEGNFLEKGEGMEIWVGENGTEVKPVRVDRYEPGEFFKKHQQLNPHLLKNVEEIKKKDIEGTKFILKEKKIDAEFLINTEMETSRIISLLKLLSTEKWQKEMDDEHRLKIKNFYASYSNLSRNMGNMPLKIKREVERKLRLKSLPDELLKRWNSLSKEEKKEMIKKLKIWSSIPFEQKEKIVRNYLRFKSLPPEKKKEILKNYKKFKKLPPEKRERIMQLYRKWKNLPEEEKERLKKKFKEFRERKMEGNPLRKRK